MGYSIGQLNHIHGGNDSNYISFITDATAGKRININNSINVSDTSAISFEDEYLDLNTSLDPNYCYYLKCYIMKKSSIQNFNVKLINAEVVEGSVYQITQEQLIKRCQVGATSEGNYNDWVEFECIFKPFVAFDKILFQLSRTTEDFLEPRYPKIIYQELGKIENIKPESDKPFLKIGVQSRPGLMMCINGEEIHTSRAGIYEVKSGILPITFFSVVEASTNSELSTAKTNIATKCATMTDEEVKSVGILNTNDAPNIDSFVLDYMYET